MSSYNGEPTAAITSHIDGETVRAGYGETLRGVIGDVVLEVRDPDGAAASVRVDLVVQPTDAPTAEITSPVTEGLIEAY